MCSKLNAITAIVPPEQINFMQAKSVYNMLMFEIKLIFNAETIRFWSVLILNYPKPKMDSMKKQKPTTTITFSTLSALNHRPCINRFNIANIFQYCVEQLRHS